MVDISFTIVFQWINFGVLIFLMTVLLYRPILNFMETRTKEIQDTIQEAEDTRTEADKLLEGYRQKLASAAAEAGQVLDEARARGEKERARLLVQAEAEAAKIMARGRESLELEERDARARLRTEVAGLSLAAAAKLLGRELTGADQRRFAEEAIRELEKSHG